MSTNIRTQLSALVGNALKREKAAAANDSEGVARTIIDEQEVMRALASHCEQLFAFLFTCAPRSEAKQADVNRIRDQIRVEKTPKSICFLVPAQ